MLKGDLCFGKKQDKASVIERLGRRYNFVTHCERIERWEVWKKRQVTWKIELYKKLFPE